MRQTLLLTITILIVLFNPMIGQNSTDTTFCKAGFSYKIDNRILSIAPSLAIQFTNSSRPDSAKYLWDFGDGNTSTEMHPFHIYSLLPKDPTQSSLISEFKACLTIYSRDGCSSTTCQIVGTKNDTIQNPCSVKFSYYKNDSIISIPEAVPFQFTGISDSKVTKWNWNFGDGSNSTLQNPAHSFNFLDTSRFVCLEIETETGCKSSYCQEVIIQSIICNADFDYAMTKSIPPVFYFRDLSKGEVSKWLWDFGDGTYSYEQNPKHIFTGSSPVPSSKEYKEVTYKICLTTSSSLGCVSSVCKDISVLVYDSIPSGDCSYKIQLNYNQILGSNSCDGSASAILVDKYGNKHDGSKYYWSNGSEESYTKGLCANFPYSVVITDNKGCETAASFALMDYSNPVPYLGFWQYRKDSLNYDFETTIKNDQLKYEWEFENGLLLEGESVSYTFSSPSGKVVLKIKDNAGNLIYSENIYLGDINKLTDTDNELPTSGTLKFYPNPVSEILYIEVNTISKPSDLTAEIFDSAGKKLKAFSYQLNSESDKIQLDVSALTKGLYFVKLKSETKPLGTVRFIK